MENRVIDRIYGILVFVAFFTAVTVVAMLLV